MVTKFKYYSVLSKWNGNCAVGEYLLKQCEIEDNEIQECRNDKRALKMFVDRHVITPEDTKEEEQVEQVDIKSSN